MLSPRRSAIRYQPLPSAPAHDVGHRPERLPTAVHDRELERAEHREAVVGQGGEGDQCGHKTAIEWVGTTETPLCRAATRACYALLPLELPAEPDGAIHGVRTFGGRWREIIQLHPDGLHV